LQKLYASNEINIKHTIIWKEAVVASRHSLEKTGNHENFKVLVVAAKIRKALRIE
jgi:hypothetical protein